jgi:hypothetical protein
MKVFIPDTDPDTFRGIYSTDDEGFYDFNRRFDGTPMKRPWNPTEVFRFVPRNLPKGGYAEFDRRNPGFQPKGRRSVGRLSGA